MYTKTLNLFASLLMIASFFSCKNNEKQDENEKQKDSNLHVIFDVVVPKDDSFQIYFNEDGSDNFTAEKFVNLDVKGSPKSQTIDFKISEQFMAKQLRFDIGSNKEHGTIKINSFKLKYYDKEFNCAAADFWKYFGNNTSINYDKKTATSTLITNLPEGFDPIFGGTSNLTVELDKLYGKTEIK
jgi:hypothetical protein